MRCQDLEVLLSVYADGELVGEERELVESHLLDCLSCQAKLKELIHTGQQLASLQITRSLPPIKDRTLAKIKSESMPFRPRSKYRSIFVALPVLAALIAILAFYIPQAIITPDEVMARVYSATEELKSFRISTTSSVKWSGTSVWVNPLYCQYEYAGNKNLHLKMGAPEGYYPQHESEVIALGEQVYYRESPQTDQVTEQLMISLLRASVENDLPSRENTLLLVTSLVNLKQMPDEKIGDIDCLHYQGDVDMERWKTEVINNLNKVYEPTDDIYKYNLEAANNISKTREMKYELWIGKKDYLIRQGKSISQTIGTGGYTAVDTTVYTDFNEPILIEPPVKPSGELQDGWQYYDLEW